MSGLILTVTDAGRAAIVNAQNNGTAPVTVASIGVTSTAFVPSKTQTALAGEIKRLTTIAGGTAAADTIHVTIRDDSTDTYSLFGIGAYLDDGTLLAVYGQSTALLEKSSQATMLLACDWQFADISAASLTFGDTNFQLASATTELQGLVELATDAETIAGTDAQRAVTPHGLVAKLTDLLGAGAPSAFVKSLLTAASAIAFRAALAIKGAALYDTGAGNGLDADLLDGQHGAYYRSYANLTGVPTTFAPSPHTHPMSDIVNLTSTLATYAPLASPALTGTPTAPNPAAASNTTQIATTAFVQQLIANLINGSPGALDTLKELADAMGDDPNFAATMTNALAGKQANLGYNPVQQGTGVGQFTNVVKIGYDNAGHVKVTIDATDFGALAFLTGAAFTGPVSCATPNTAGGNPSSYSFRASGAYGGGYALQDGAYAITMFSIAGALNFGFGTATSSTSKASIDANGNFYANGSVTATGGFQVSDRRAKTNIEPRAIDTTLAGKLAPLWSQWNLIDGGRFDTALIAQDVLIHAPQFVQVPDDPDAMLSIDKAGIALECALSAELRINQLLARIEALEQAA